MLMWKQFIFSMAVILLTGCSNLLSSSTPVDRPGWTVTKAYQAALNGNSDNNLHTIRHRLPHQLVTQNDANEPARIPNPDIVLYIYPHYIGNGMTTRIPGYKTVFPLYKSVEYQ